MGDSPTGGGGGGSGGGQDPGFGGYATLQELVDAVVFWIPYLTTLFLSRYQGKYRAWSSNNGLAAGAPQLEGQDSESNEEAILELWSALSAKKRESILQYALSYRSGDPSCARKFVRGYAECEEVVIFNGQSYCVRGLNVSDDICNQSSAPASCRRVISSWKGLANCDNFPDSVATNFYNWLSARVVSGSDSVKSSSLRNFYFYGFPRKRKS